MPPASSSGGWRAAGLGDDGACCRAVAGGETPDHDDQRNRAVSMPSTRRPPSTSSPSLRAVLLGAVALLVLALSGPLAAGAQAATGEFETLASSPVDLTSIAVDTDTQVIYAQQNEGSAFFSYDPATNEWKELTEAPLTRATNGGATFLA